ncbi:MAG TPA: glycosyltransferase family 39 protein [Thermoanaerobaculia bacterium]|nr:glycosyltransferase family 39 protein [Thermoanaerobaculia bacterium]
MSRHVAARRPGKAALVFRRIRPVALGSLALYFAVRGQGLVASLATRGKGTLDYAIAVELILLAWIGTYRNRALASRSESEPPRPWRTPSRSELAVVFLSVVVNVLAVLELRRRDYDSLAAGGVWLASLVLLALAAAGPRRRQADPAIARDRGRPWNSRRLDLLLAVLFFLFGLALRLYRLGDWTTGMHGDEGEVGLNALEILKNPRISPFRTGWFGQPNFYYWGVALGMKIFGTGLAGLRAFSAVAGALLLLPFYPLVRRLFGSRTAVAATLLLAVSGPAIHFSKQEFSNITTPMLLVAGFLFLVRGFEERRMLPFVLAGYAHLACLYFYLGGRLTPLIAAAFFAYLLLAAALRKRFADIPPLLRAGFFYAAAAICMAGPWIAYYVDHRHEWDSRVNEKLIFRQPATMESLYKVRHEPLGIPLPDKDGRHRALALVRDGFWPRVIWSQVKATLSILTWNFDRSGVYITLEPATEPFESVLVVFGIAWALWRWRDERMAMLSIWFWLTIFVGGVLTIDAPYLARLVGILPLLAIFSGVVLDKLALEVERLWRRSTSREGRASDARSVVTVAVLLAVALMSERSLRDYFGRFLGSRPFSGGMSFASFVRDTEAQAAREGRPGPMFYALGAHGVYWGYSVNRFLNPGSTGEDVLNASDALPVIDNRDRDAVFLVWDDNRQYLPAIHLDYPKGEEGRYRYGPPGRESEKFSYYRVRREEIEARRALTAAYRSADGRQVERSELGPGAMPPPEGLRYPARAEWKGQLFAPAFGRYRFRLESPGEASLALDGRTFLAGSDPSDEAAVVLARGLHALSVSATLPGPKARIRLDWGVADSDLRAVPERFFWSGPPAGLLGEIRWKEGEAPDAREWVEYRRDAFLGFRQAEQTLGVGHPTTAVWKGTLQAPESPSIVFETLCNNGCTVSADGKPVLENRSPDNAPRRDNAQAELSAGAHPIEISYLWGRGFGHLEVYWAPSGEPRELLEAPAVSAAGGAWLPDEVRETRPLYPEMIGAAPAAPAQPHPPAPVGDERGCAVGADGTAYLADAGGHRLEVLERTGRLAAVWGKGGTGPGEYQTIQDVAVLRDGRVAVLDAGLSRVQLYSSGGKLAGAIEKVGCSPAGLAVGPADDLYIASPCDSAVSRYSSSGSLLAKFTGGADRSTRLDQPVDVAVSADGKIYAADLEHRIVEIDPKTDTIRRSWPVHVSSAFGGAKLAISGETLYLTDPDRGGLFVVDTSTGQVRALAEATRPALSEFARQRRIWPCLDGFSAVFPAFGRCSGEILAHCSPQPAAPADRGGSKKSVSKKGATP